MLRHCSTAAFRSSWVLVLDTVRMRESKDENRQISRRCWGVARQVVKKLSPEETRGILRQYALEKRESSG